MDLFGINIIAVIIATVVGMALGALWYSPILFGQQWMRAVGKTPETLGNETLPMVGSIVASLLMAIGVAIIFSLSHINSLPGAIGLGLCLGLLIIFPALLSDNLFCGWGTPLLLIQSGYRALAVLLMSIVIGLLG